MDNTLYGLDKKGGFKVWHIKVEPQNEDVASITITHGKEGGKLQEKVALVAKGKQGRTVFEQAVNEAKGKLKKQIDKGYRENKDDLEELPLLAMLASDYRKQGHRIQFPCYTSFKLDGVRCLAKKNNGVVTLESRTGQHYSLPHIEIVLSLLMEDREVWDGEIYLHGETLQDITSAVKRTDPQKEIDKCERKVQKAVEGSTEWFAAKEELAEAERIHILRDCLNFQIFDIPSDKKFSDRLRELNDLDLVAPDISVLDYKVAYSEEDMFQQHKEAVQHGYEGIMLRNSDGMYESGKRSADLQKYKEFLDDEFKILDVEADKQNGSRFLVQNDLNDQTFYVVMGSMDERARNLEVREELIGRWLKVKYQSRYKDTLLPQFPVGLEIRECDAEGNPLD